MSCDAIAELRQAMRWRQLELCDSGKNSGWEKKKRKNLDSLC